MKTKHYSTLTIALAVFTIGISSPNAFATPKNKVPGASYHTKRVDKNTGPRLTDSKISKNCSKSEACEKRADKKKTVKGTDRPVRKSYWKKKIGI